MATELETFIKDNFKEAVLLMWPKTWSPFVSPTEQYADRLWECLKNGVESFGPVVVICNNDGDGIDIMERAPTEQEYAESDDMGKDAILHCYDFTTKQFKGQKFTLQGRDLWVNH